MTEYVYYDALNDRLIFVQKSKGELWATSSPTTIRVDGEIKVIHNYLGLIMNRIRKRSWNKALKEGCLIKLGKL